MWFQRSFASSFLFIAAVSAAIIQQQPLRKSWSSASDLSALSQELNETVAGKLIEAAPIGKPCYSPLSAECSMVNANKRSDIWTTDQAGGYFYSNWASCQATGETCTIPLTDGAVPPNWVCRGGSVPPLMINLTDMDTMVDDVKAAFKFASDTKKPLVIKNTGHDWKGRSTAPDSLAIWTHALKHPHVRINKTTNFVPNGCSNYPKDVTVFHYGPGQQWGDAYKVAEDHNLTVVGGSCPSVGIAGWLQGGGHSPLTPRHGMGADNLLQVEILTPKGDLLVANECQNKDIFFAIRGGGGGTWGFVTRITYRAIKSFEVQDFHVSSMAGLSRTDMEEYFKIFTKNAVALSKNGWGGYVKSAAGGPSFELSNSGISLDEAKTDMAEVTSFLESRGYRNGVNYTFKTHSSWNTYAKEVFSPPQMHQAYGSLNPISRLLPAQVFHGSSKDDLDAALMRLYDNGLAVWLMFVTPTRFNHTSSSSLHPSWDYGVMSVRANAAWNQFSDVTNSIPARSHFELLHHAFEGIRQLGPDMGVSVSEADIWEVDHARHFWGEENYEKLLKVKREVDPDNILSNWHAVNWTPSDARYKCYPKSSM